MSTPTESVHSRSKPAISSISARLIEATKCLALGFRDALHPRLIGFSLGVWLLAFIALTVAFIVFRDAIGLLSGVLAKYIVLGVFVFLPQSLPSGIEGMVAAPIAGMKDIGVAVAGGNAAFTVLRYLLIAAMFAVTMLVTVRLLLELFLMGRIQKQALKTYPHIRPGADLPLRLSVRNFVQTWLIFLFGGAIFLMIPVLNGVFIFTLLSYLNVKGLVNDALDGIADENEYRTVIKEERLTMVVLGIGLVGILLIPFVALIGPVLMGSSACHLCMRKISNLRERNNVGQSSSPTPTENPL